MKLRLLPRMILSILLPALLGMVLLSMVSNQLSREAMQKQIFEDMCLLADTQSSELENLLSALRGAVDTLSEVNRVMLVLEAIQQGAPEDKVQALLPAAKNSLDSFSRNFKRVKSAGVVDVHGKVISHSLPETVGISLMEYPFFAETMKGKSVITTMKNPETKLIDIIITSPVKDGNMAVGIVYATLNMEQLITTTVGKIVVGKTGLCFVYDENGVLFMHKDSKRIGEDDSNSPWVQAALRNGTGSLHYEYEGVSKYGFYATVPLTKWIVMIALDEDDMMAPISRMTQILLVLTLGAILVVGIIIFMTARGLAASLRGGAAFTQYIAAGNLTISAEQQAMLDKEAQRSDEIGELSGGVLTMTLNLIKTVGEAKQKTEEAEKASLAAQAATQKAEEATLRAESAKREGMLAAAHQLEGVVESVTSASAQLSAQIEQSDRGSSEQASRVAETATAMEEMNSTVLEVARNSGIASDSSAAMRKKAENGSSVVQSAVQSILRVQKESLDLKQKMGTLDEQTRSISQIMGVISDIADQTNLLALNAAIEAARAGEAGRGFAVVADEVRKLAEKTMVSTADVGEAIRNIQQSATSSMLQVDVAVNVIEEATLLATQSGESLHEIVGLVDTTSDQVRAIATAAEQQSATSEEINRSIGHVSTIANDTSRAMQEAAQAVSELAHQAQILNSMVEDMKNG